MSSSKSFRQQQFLDVIDRDEAERRFQASLDLRPLDAEPIPIDKALSRVLAETIFAPIDVPSFDRSNMDGFALRAEDTYGASEDAPRTFVLNSEVLVPGRVPEESLDAGSATSIATGGMIPRGADAVMMIEHTDVEGAKLLVRKAVVPGTNITFAGTDIGRGEVVLRRGETLSARETGVLAALGLGEVSVVRRPRVAIVSTGDELLPPGEPTRLGGVYDSNGIILADTVRELGGEPVPLGIVRDDETELTRVLRDALRCDVVLLSGGTSKGEGDISYRVVGSLGEPGIVVHGVALKPGKPLCLAAIEPGEGRRRVPVIVLPGFPTSAIFTFREFVAPILERFAGHLATSKTQQVPARLPMRINSVVGRTEYNLVGLVENEEGGGYTAYPMGKGSGSVTTFSRADGFLVIDRNREYLDAGTSVEVHLLSRSLRLADLVVIGSHCPGLDYLLGQLDARGIRSKLLSVGSSAGLEAAKRGECDIAGVHLLDPQTGEYNRPFLTPKVHLVAGYRRRQGIVYRRGDERFENCDVERALANALADSGCVLINRNRGSGTRIVIDRLLGAARPTGYLTESRSHNAVVAAIVQRRADWGVAVQSSLPLESNPSLGFLPLCEEQYDFVVPQSRWNRSAVEQFRALLGEEPHRLHLETMGYLMPKSEENLRGVEM